MHGHATTMRAAKHLTLRRAQPATALAFGVLALLAAPAVATAASGDLDPSWGSGGMVATRFQVPYESGEYQTGNGVALQPADRKVVVVGQDTSHVPIEGGGQVLALARYNSNGTPDGSFGTGGFVRGPDPPAPAVTPPATRTGATDVALGVAIQPDGKIVISGQRIYDDNRNGGPSNQPYASDVLVARFQTDGSPDPSFGSGGFVTTNVGPFGSGNRVAVQGGKVVVVGSTGGAGSDFVVLRYDSGGLPDGTFSGDGKEVTDFGGSDFGKDLVVQSDGSVIAGGYTAQSGGSSFALARYTSLGALDTAAFGTGGKVTTAFPTPDATAAGLAAQADGKVLAVGTANNDFALARYDATTGALDSTFGSGGKLVTDFSGDGSAVDVLSDGRIVAAGTALVDGPANGCSFNPCTAFGLVQLNPDGKLDSGFGQGGKVTSTMASASGAIANDLAVGAQDRPIAAGWTYRPNDDGAPELVFGAARFLEETGPPTISLSRPANNARYKLGQNVVAKFSCSDPDGAADVSVCRGTVASGLSIDTSTAGSHAFTVQARDAAGKTTTKTVHYTVVTSETTPPALKGLPQDQSCIPKGLKVHVSVHPTRLKQVIALLDGKQVARSKNPDFTLKIAAKKLKPGRHKLVIERDYKSGTKRRSTFTFTSCVGGGKSPHIRTQGTPDRGTCTAKSFAMVVTITGSDPKTVVVKLDGKPFSKPGKAKFTLTVNVPKLKRGAHHLTITAADKHKNSSLSVTDFVRC